MKRWAIVLTAALLLVGLVAGPAGATKPDATGTHQITICHATNSATNPYVVVTIDVAAWQNDGQVRHSPDHHVNRKTGTVDGVWDGTSCTAPGGGSDVTPLGDAVTGIG